MASLGTSWTQGMPRARAASRGRDPTLGQEGSGGGAQVFCLSKNNDTCSCRDVEDRVQKVGLGFGRELRRDPVHSDNGC